MDAGVCLRRELRSFAPGAVMLSLLVPAGACAASPAASGLPQGEGATESEGGAHVALNDTHVRTGDPDRSGSEGLAFEVEPQLGSETPSSDGSGSAEIVRPAACPSADTWPDGMACVLGGTFELGDPEGRPDEQVPGAVYVDTFFMDLYEVTNARYETCIAASRCERPMRFRRFMGEDQPVVAVSWYDAQNFCAMVGRRLPTEAEWERAAAGPEDTRYPWGDEPLGCERANVQDAAGRGCGRDLSRPVGSYPAGHWGLFDMAGNVHEWVADWYSDCLRGCDDACGDACFGDNPTGPCAGAERCPGHPLKSVRGGSWYWPLPHARAQARRGSGAPNRGPHRFGFRCARDLAPSPDVSETEAP